MKRHPALVSLHKSLASSHSEQKAHCEKITTHFQALADGMSKTPNDGDTADSKSLFEGLSSEFEAQAGRHANRAAHHEQCAEECAMAAKAEEDELDKVVPLGVSRVAPTRPAVIAVPRAGQKEIEKTVPLQFRSLVEIDDDLG
jgi:hypothetical protein